MPPERTTAGPSIKSKPFKPVRPSKNTVPSKEAIKAGRRTVPEPKRTSAGPSKSPAINRPSKTATLTAARRSTPSHIIPASDSSAASDPDVNSSAEAEVEIEEEIEAAEIEVESQTTIPPKLLSRLLHEFFTDQMRISKGADAAVGKYMEIFVKEAIARAAYERSAIRDGGRDKGDGFMEVEDLEKLAPQLVLDF